MNHATAALSNFGANNQPHRWHRKPMGISHDTCAHRSGLLGATTVLKG